MGRLRKDYSPRQRSTSFQCLAHICSCTALPLGIVLLLTCRSLQVGKGRNHRVTEQTCSPSAPASQLCAMPTLRREHPLPLSSSLPKSLHSEPGRCSYHISLSPLQTIWSFPMLLRYRKPWPQKYCVWPIFLLVSYSLSFSLWHLPCCVKRGIPAPFATCSVKICIDGDFKEDSMII